MWFCDACTFKNTQADQNCTICGTARGSVQSEATWTCGICTFVNPEFMTNCGGCTTQKNIALGKSDPGRSPPKQQHSPIVQPSQPSESEQPEPLIQSEQPEQTDEDVNGVTFPVFKKICQSLSHISGAEMDTLMTFAKDTYRGRSPLSIDQVRHIFEANTITFDQLQFESAWKSLDGEDSWDDDGEEMEISANHMEQDDDSWGDDDAWSDEEFEANGDVPVVNEDDITDQITQKLVEKESESWKMIGLRELFELRRKIVEDWASFLGMENDLGKVVILCHHFRWNRDRCIEELAKEDTMKQVGLECDPKDVCTVPLDTSKDTLTCQVCFCDEPVSDVGWLDECKHTVCGDCWSNWLKSEIETKGPSCIFTKCPGGCKLVVHTSLWDRFLKLEHKPIFRKHLASSFVQGSGLVKSCPGRGCEKFVYYPCGGQQDIECSCGEKWCFNCGLPAHEPCTCHHAQLWEERNSSDKDNVNWIRANTKKCPNCHSNIEKNQGCMHMRCTNCKHEFCWMCGESWFNHRSRTHAGCNKSDAVLKSESEAQKAKGSLQRYMFYYSRFEAHEKALEFAKKNEKIVQQKMTQMMAVKEDWNFNTVIFLKDAVEEVVRCRRILQWSYCFGFYLADGSREKNLFEDHQGRLEVFADRLHELTEKDVSELLDIEVRSSVIRLTKTVEKFRIGVKDYTNSMVFVEYKEQDAPKTKANAPKPKPKARLRLF